jgi:Tfp pilus assembly PilM family ATPase
MRRSSAIDMRDALALEIGPRWLRALLGMQDGGRLRVGSVLEEPVPPAVDPDDAEALGAWIAGRLSSAGLRAGRVTLAVPREYVVLKRLTLPTVDTNELPDMTRLALQRDMPFDAGQAVIDFVVADRTDAHTTVIAVAVPESVRRRMRAIVEAAGLTLDRVGLRAMGSAALLTSLDAYRNECVLLVDVTAGGVEFSILEHGVVRFSRAAALDAKPERAEDDDGPAPAPAPEAVAESVITETRRTWMSYRIVEGASDVTRVALLGDPAVTSVAAPPIGAMLDAEARVIDDHPLITAGGAPMDRVWPLAGMLLETTLRKETIDFANPRRPVDRAARVRRRAVIAAGVLAVVLLGMWTVARRQLGTLDTQLTKLEQRQSDLRPRYQRYQRDVFTLAHLRQWERVDVRWLEHMEALRSIMPPASDAVLDGWIGTLDFRGVRYDKTEKAWSAPLQLDIVVDGVARDRATADSVRAAFVDADGYRASSSGTDSAGGKRLPFGFTYRLTTSDGAPATAAPETDEGGDAG